MLDGQRSEMGIGDEIGAQPRAVDESAQRLRVVIGWSGYPDCRAGESLLDLLPGRFESPVIVALSDRERLRDVINASDQARPQRDRFGAVRLPDRWGLVESCQTHPKRLVDNFLEPAASARADALESRGNVGLQRERCAHHLNIGLVMS